MTVLSSEARQQWSDARQLCLLAVARVLYAAGWLTAKTLRVLATSVAVVLFGAGWFAASVAWPAACWCGRAARLGWDQGRKPVTR